MPLPTTPRNRDLIIRRNSIFAFGNLNGEGWGQRDRIFFSLKKFAAIHSLDFRNHNFFFPKTRGKNTAVLLFFSQKEFTCHSLNFSGGALIKNRGKWYIFSKKLFSTQFLLYFFYPRSVFFSLYFFFPE